MSKPRHHSVFHTVRGDGDPAPLIYSIVNESDWSTTDDNLTNESDADIIALYRDIQAGYVPTPGELAGTDWHVLVRYLGEF